MRDLRVAQHLAVGEPSVSQGDLEFLDLCTLGVAAVYRKDNQAPWSVLRQMASGKPRPWQQGISTCLTGVADRRPEQVAEGLTLLIDGIRSLRQKDELEEAICVPAHGLYRLCEWVSPDLVARFDVKQSFPWDGEFHAWCQGHSDSLTGLDLAGISPVLHEAVVRLQPPTWWESPSVP